MEKDYVLGLDFGTSSVRTILVEAHSGEKKASSEFMYPRWGAGKFCDPAKNIFRQHPMDHLEGLEHTVKEIVEQVGSEISSNIRSLSICTTGSTPIAVDNEGIPLSFYPEFENNPNAMFLLWKDHTAIKEAKDINQHSIRFNKNYLSYVGGIYSSEWFWAKLLHVLRQDEKVRERCFSWVEHCDWLPFHLTGGNNAREIKRSACAAGHKALWAKQHGGLPGDNFFSTLDSLLKRYENLYNEVFTSDFAAGNLSSEWAEKLNLSVDVKVGIGGLDAHFGAIGAEIKPFYLNKVMGTSTCDMLVIPAQHLDGPLIRGICGQVESSIVPGMIGMEAGQSAFGDIFEWFRDLLFWPLKDYMPSGVIANGDETLITIKEFQEGILEELSKEAAELTFDVDSEVTVDWLNGRRTPDANQSLKGAVFGLTLGSTAPIIFRSLVEASCFGSKRIVERFREGGIPVKGIIGTGGVAKKSEFVMQMMADVLEMPIHIPHEEQTGALGAAMFAATVGGIFSKVEESMDKMGKGFEKEYVPVESRSLLFRERYYKYLEACASLDPGML